MVETHVYTVKQSYGIVKIGSLEKISSCLEASVTRVFQLFASIVGSREERQSAEEKGAYYEHYH